jgi:3-polyprenyl-4-hydroxybenzoate decarboxylase
MSLSGKQLKKALDYSFKGGSSTFIDPVLSLAITPSEYTINTSGVATISSLELTGSIEPNNGTEITFDLQDALGNSLQSGSYPTAIYFSVPTPIPTTSQTYYLVIQYTTDTGSFKRNLSTSVSTIVTSEAKVGQLANESQNFSTAAEFAALNVESGFTVKSKSELINKFEISTPNTGRVVIIVPNSMGTVADISDGITTSVLDEFTGPILDSTGIQPRKIYVSTNALTPPTDGKYDYKIIFS